MKKFDQGKLPYHLLPADSLEMLVKVLQFGANKYGGRNWEEGTDWSRLFAASMRHLWAFWKGENLDIESKLPHLAHALCCILFVLTYYLRKIGKDDRP